MALTGVGGPSAAWGGDAKTGGAAGVACVRAERGLEAAAWTSGKEPGIGIDGEETGAVAWPGCGDTCGGISVR